ncbi:MAG: hypothetical protein ACXWT1_03555 [Methylobacter sp.]
MTSCCRFLPLSAPRGCETSAAGLLSALPNDKRFKKGLHFFYCHTHLLKSDKGGEVSQLLVDSITGSEVREWDKDVWEPMANSVIILDTTPVKDLAKQAVSAFGKLRIALYGEGKFRDRPAFVLCPPMLQDLRGYPDLVSHVGCDGYCLWDDGGLWEASAWQVPDKLALAWRGNGWPHTYISDGANAKGTELSSVLENRINRAAEDLDLYGRSLLDYVTKHDSEHLPALVRKPGVSYVAALLEFLPGYRREPIDLNQIPFPCHSAGGHGGPMPWPGMGALHQHLRHLFLDGWLTLWPVGDELYLHPASLALLYWAARWADKPFTQSPEQFIKHYAWDRGEWFGGHWKGNRHG